MHTGMLSKHLLNVKNAEDLRALILFSVATPLFAESYTYMLFPNDIEATVKSGLPPLRMSNQDDEQFLEYYRMRKRPESPLPELSRRNTPVFMTGLPSRYKGYQSILKDAGYLEMYLLPVANTGALTGFWIFGTRENPDKLHRAVTEWRESLTLNAHLLHWFCCGNTNYLTNNALDVLKESDIMALNLRARGTPLSQIANALGPGVTADVITKRLTRLAKKLGVDTPTEALVKFSLFFENVNKGSKDEK